jgi:flavin reductase (DIM6/NTAB) family NADH-FMN oxidoreductase RutF
MSSQPLGSSSAAIDKRRFCLACGRYATGVAVATVLDAAGEPHGITVNSFTSVSLAPLLILICIDHRARVLDHFHPASPFAVNVLSEFQRPLSDHFASSQRDRFEGVEWYPSSSGVPLLPRALAHLECTVHKRVPAGDHDIVLGEVLAARIEEGRPLVYFASGYHKLVAES